MLSGLSDFSVDKPRARLLWAVLGVLIVGQLVALWLLCTHQVRQAEARQTAQHVQQLALADCLQYIPGATIATCISRLGRNGRLPPADDARAEAAATAAPARAAMPVSFSR